MPIHTKGGWWKSHLDSRAELSLVTQQGPSGTLRLPYVAGLSECLCKVSKGKFWVCTYRNLFNTLRSLLGYTNGSIPETAKTLGKSGKYHQKHNFNCLWIPDHNWSQRRLGIIKSQWIAGAILRRPFTSHSSPTDVIKSVSQT